MCVYVPTVTRTLLVNTFKRAVKTNRFVCRLYALLKQTLKFVSTFFISRTHWKLPFALRILCLIFFSSLCSHRNAFIVRSLDSQQSLCKHTTWYTIYFLHSFYIIQIRTGCIENILKII